MWIKTFGLPASTAAQHSSGVATFGTASNFKNTSASEPETSLPEIIAVLLGPIRTSLTDSKLIAILMGFAPRLVALPRIAMEGLDVMPGPFSYVGASRQQAGLPSLVSCTLSRHDSTGGAGEARKPPVRDRRAVVNPRAGLHLWRLAHAPKSPFAQPRARSTAMNRKSHPSIPCATAENERWPR